MSCCGQRVTSDIYQNCCNGNNLCEFNGDLKNVVTAPIYVQQVFDGVSFHMQGMKTVSNQCFTPAIPANHRIKKVIDIRGKRYFNPDNIEDPNNLNVELDTGISGATFLKQADGSDVLLIGPDGSYSERILYADTTECDDACQGTPVFGTQTISISGNVLIEIDLLLCDNCNNEICYTICAEVEIASTDCPMVLTNFFEICMPSTFETAFFPRFTEFSNTAVEGRLATNNCGRDLSVDADGNVSGNLILAICINCEKKIIVPVQICVLSTGYAIAPVQHNSICTTFPSLFPEPIKISDTESCLEERQREGTPVSRESAGCGCPEPARRPQPRR